jgi:signal transduction histidine kinase
LDAFLKEIAQRGTSRHANIHIETSRDLPEVKLMGDSTRLAQVFDNLFTNASKYAPGSKVFLAVSIEQQSAVIAISDNGPGIAGEHLSQLFKRFYRLPSNDSNIRGTGLGLFICRQIVRAHGGSIWAESELGEGTTFYVKLPLGLSEFTQDLSLRESS